MTDQATVCRELTAAGDAHPIETPDQHPRTAIPTSPAMRQRGMSLRSGPPMPTVPENTPAASTTTVNSNSIATSTASQAISVGERLIRPVAARLENLQRERPGMFWELDTTAPENTPISTSILRPQNQGLPAFDEIISRLPPPRNGPRSNDGASDFEIQSVQSGEMDSIRSEYGGSPNAARRAPPPTPVTQSQFARSVVTSPEVRSPAGVMDPSEAAEMGDQTPERTVIASLPKDGVLEYSDWEHDVEEVMAEALARLAQLAVDKAKKDPSVTAEDFYRRKLDKIINNPSRPFRPGPIDLSRVSLPELNIVQPTLSTPTRAEIKIMELRITRVEETVSQLHQMLAGMPGKEANGVNAQAQSKAN